MTLSDAEFEEILSDRTKRIVEDIRWTPDPDHPPGMVFAAPIDSARRWPLTMHGSWYPQHRTLYLNVALTGTGAILRLCVGFSEHRNPEGARLGPVHKHRWTARLRDRQAYEPDDITADWDEPLIIWQQFCQEVGIVHLGTLFQPET